MASESYGKSGPYGNPMSLNSNHWRAHGPTNVPVSGRRILIGSALIVGASAVLFKLLGMGRETPVTITAEWRREQARRGQERGNNAVTQHKPGAAVKVVEPSILEENGDE